MEKTGKLKSSIGRTLTALFDLMALNLMWLVCLLPVITAGPATVALFSVMLKVAREEPVATFRAFFASFKCNLKQGILFGLAVLAAAAVIAVDFMYARSAEGFTQKLFFFVSGVLTILLLVFFTYMPALIARFENTFKGHFVNAFALAALNPFRTVLMWIVYAIPVALLVILPFEAVATVGWAYLILGFSLPAYVNARTLRTVFDRIEKKESEDAEAEEESGEEPEQSEEE